MSLFRLPYPSWCIGAATLIVASAVGARFFVDPPTDFRQDDYQGLPDIAKKVLVDKDGSIYVAGTATSTTHGKDFWLVKYTAVGSTITYVWDAHYDGPSHGDDELTGLALDKDGNIYMSGSSEGSGTGYDFAVYAVDPATGFPLWAGDGAARYNSGSAYDDMAHDLAIDANGNLIVCGDCETASNGLDAMVVVFTPAGAVKTGFPVFSSTAQDESFTCVDVDSSFNIDVGGYHFHATNLDDLLVAQYAGGGSLVFSRTLDSGNGGDVVKDITHSATGQILTASTLAASGGTRLALHAWDSDNATPVWSQVYGSDSYVDAIAYADGFVYATGTLQGGLDEMLTVKLNASDGSYSTTWPSPTGVRTLAQGSGRSLHGHQLFVGGSNLYVVGSSTNTNNIPLASDYLVTRYSKDGTTPSTSFWPNVYPNSNFQVDAGNAIFDFCAGQAVATGKHAPTAQNGNDDMGTLLFEQDYGTALATHTVEVGTLVSGNDASLESSDNSYLVVQNGSGRASSKAQVICSGNVGNGPVTELCFEVEAKSISGIDQKIELFNYVTGEYDTLDLRPASTSDRKLHVVTPGDPSKYIDTSAGNVGNVKARIAFIVADTIDTLTWTASIDQAVWRYLGL